jgi:hypothetical protein
MLLTQIGETAGRVWSLLHEKGPQSLNSLKKQIKAPADVVLMSIGWLAREDKLEVEHKGRVQTVRLK